MLDITVYKGVKNVTINRTVCTGWDHYHVSAEMFPDSLLRKTPSDDHPVREITGWFVQLFVVLNCSDNVVVIPFECRRK